MFNFIKGMLSDVGIGKDYVTSISMDSRHYMARSIISYQIYPSDEFIHVYNQSIELHREVTSFESLNDKQAEHYEEWLGRIKYHQETLETSFNLKPDVDYELENGNLTLQERVDEFHHRVNRS